MARLRVAAALGASVLLFLHLSRVVAAGAPAPQDARVEDVRIVGGTVLTDQVEAIVGASRGKLLSPDQVRAVGTQVTRCYLEHGYLTSRAVASVKDGILLVEIREGKLASIVIENEGDLHLRPSYIKGRASRGAHAPLRADTMEGQLRLLRADPAIANLEASLRASGAGGESILALRVKEASRVSGRVSADSYGPPSTGSARAGASVVWRNPTGLGDALSAAVGSSSTGGSRMVEAGYTVPVNLLDGTVRVSAARYWTKTTEGAFEDLDIEGARAVYGLQVRQPILRTFGHELALSLGFVYSDGQTFLFQDLGTPFGIGPDENGVSRTSVAELGLTYARRGSRHAFALSSNLRLGTDAFDATRNEGDVPDGRFSAWVGQAQVAVWLGERQQWVTQATVQLTTDPLLSSEQFAIGGVYSVRGYRQNARVADRGYRFSTEDRFTVRRDGVGRATLLAVPFVDVGAVENVPENPNLGPEKETLVGLGLGVIWQPRPSVTVRGDFARPFVDLDDRGDNLQDDGVYLSVTYDPTALAERLFGHSASR